MNTKASNYVTCIAPGPGVGTMAAHGWMTSVTPRGPEAVLGSPQFAQRVQERVAARGAVRPTDEDFVEVAASFGVRLSRPGPGAAARAVAPTSRAPIPRSSSTTSLAGLVLRRLAEIEAEESARRALVRLLDRAGR